MFAGTEKLAKKVWKFMQYPHTIEDDRLREEISTCNEVDEWYSPSVDRLRRFVVPSQYHILHLFFFFSLIQSLSQNVYICMYVCIEILGFDLVAYISFLSCIEYDLSHFSFFLLSSFFFFFFKFACQSRWSRV